MKMPPRRGLLAALAAAGLAAGLAPAVAAYPEKPIRVIVPVAAGGSTDLVARILQLALERTKGLPQPLAVVNNAAAGGTVGTRMIKDAEPDGYTIGIWHMGLLTAPAMGVVDYDHNAYELVAQVGRIQIGLGVRDDSRFKSARELIDEAKGKPDTVTVATNIGLLPHFVPLMLAQETGARFRFVQSGGGALRLKSIMGGHTEMSLFSVPEFINFKANGIRPLMLFANERNSAAPDIPAIKEAGFATTFEERILVLAPKGTPADRVKLIAEAFRKVLADPEVVQRFKEQGIENVFLEGAALKASLDEAAARVNAVAAEVKRQQAAEKKQ
jgi:tripartite-type tricarboxylate transporter receptor subunit TctC